MVYSSILNSILIMFSTLSYVLHWSSYYSCTFLGGGWDRVVEYFIGISVLGSLSLWEPTCYALCVSGAVSTYGFVRKFLSAISTFSFIHLFIEAEGQSVLQLHFTTRSRSSGAAAVSVQGGNMRPRLFFEKRLLVVSHDQTGCFHICLHRLLSGLLIVSQTLTTDFVSDAKTKLQCSGWTWNNRSTCKSVSSSMRTMTCFRQFKSCTNTETISIVSSMKCLKSVLLQDLLSLLTKSCLKQRHIKVYARSFPPRWVTSLAEGALVSFIDDYCFPEPSENKVYIPDGQTF